MKEYLWQPYGQGSYLLDKMSHGDGGEIRRYVEYPLKDDDVWRFNEVTEEKDGYEDTDGWTLSETEENEIKSYIRNVLKPNDLCETNKDSWSDKYFWDKVYDGNYMLEYVENTDTRIVRHEVNYPIKGDTDGWHFFTSKTINGEDMDFDSWDLPTEEQERIKSYIRDVLKPNDLYEESEVEKMKEQTVLSFGVPSELVEEVKSIISRFEGVPADVNFKGDQNPLDVAEIERLTKENEDLKNELNKGHETVNNLSDKYSDAKDFITDFVQYQYDRLDSEDFALFFNKFFFSEDKIREYGLSEYVPERYKLTKVKAIQTNEIEIVVLQKEDDNYNADTILFNTREEEVEGFFDSYSVESSYEFEEKDTIADNLTKEQVMDRYSQSEIFTSKDCENIWY